MDTAVISYRVADFLKQYAPFNAISESDLVSLCSNGRVRFFEPHEYVLWQGEPHRLHVFVIQQGTVSLWEDLPGGSTLRDVRGAGDMLGVERYNNARACLYTARSENDVLVYAFPAADFEAFVLKYSHAVEYVTAESRVKADYLPPDAQPELSRMFLYDVARRRAMPTCSATDSVANVARQLLATRSEAIVVLDREDRARGVVTTDAVLRWVADGAESSSPHAIDALTCEQPAIVAPTASVADGLLQMGVADVEPLIMTHDGTAGGRVQALITRRDLAAVLGDDPGGLLRQARVASSAQELRDLNQRARAFVLEHLVGPSAVEWLTMFTSLFDAAALTRLLVLQGIEHRSACWCFGGSAGRGESLPKTAPLVLAVFADGVPDAVAQKTFQDVIDGLGECGYLPGTDRTYDAGFYAAGTGEWRARYRGWVDDPVRQEAYRARSLFDVRPVHGDVSQWQTVLGAANEAMNPAFMHLLANDCLDSLPPLTFFEDAVIDRSGEHADTFRLEYSALQPLVDVARVFALAAGNEFGRSTLQRLAAARELIPDHEAIFREASDTLRVVLWQQGRVGISRGTNGAELPAALLSRHDRQVLKSGFRSILGLLEFTADREWLKRL